MKGNKKLSAKPTAKPQAKKTATKPASKPAPKKTTAQPATTTPPPAPSVAPTKESTSNNPPAPPSLPPEQTIQKTQEVEQPKPSENSQQINQQQTEVQHPQEKSYETVAYDPTAISSFYDLDNYELEVYDLKNVSFLSFDGVTNLTNANSIFITNALFTSFNYTQIMPKLKKCSFSGSPIYFRTHYRLMILLAFGEQIEEIDNTPVTNLERRIFNHFNKETIQLLSDYVHKGGLIMQNVDEKFVEELKQKQCPLLQFDIPVKHIPINHIYYTPFLKKRDIDQFLLKEISQNERNLKESEEVKDEKEQRTLITSIEREIFESQNKLPSQSLLCKICDPKEIQEVENNAFNKIGDVLSKILKQLQDSEMQIPKHEGDNILSWIYHPVFNIIKEAQDKTESLLTSLNSNSRSFSFICKSCNSYNTIFKKSCGFSPILNFMRERYYQLINILNSYSFISIPAELHEIEDPTFHSLFKEDVASNLPKIVEAINGLEDQEKKQKLLDSKVIENLEIQLNGKSIAENSARSLKKASAYIKLIEKCPNSRYFTSFASIFHSSSEIYAQIPDSIQNKNKGETMQFFLEMESFSNCISREFNQIVKVNQLIPKYSDIKLAIDQSIGEAKTILRNFEIEKIEKLKEKVHKYWVEGNEYQQERKKIAERVDKMLQFIIDSNNYQYNCETPFLVSDLTAFAEEFVLSNDPAKRQQIQDQLNKLDEESDNKDKEIQELLAQCAELGINV